MSSIVIGLIIGYLVAWGLGRIDFSAVQSFGGFNIPLPFKYGLDFDFSAFIALGLVFLITAIEAYGDITANSLISGEPVEGKHSSNVLREEFWQTDSIRCWQVFSTLFQTPFSRKITV